MQYRNLGRTGIKVSEICLGIMNFGSQVDEKGAIQIIMERALDAGSNLFHKSQELLSVFSGILLIRLINN